MLAVFLLLVAGANPIWAQTASQNTGGTSQATSGPNPGPSPNLRGTANTFATPPSTGALLPPTGAGGIGGTASVAPITSGANVCDCGQSSVSRAPGAGVATSPVIAGSRTGDTGGSQASIGNQTVTGGSPYAPPGTPAAGYQGGAITQPGLQSQSGITAGGLPCSCQR